MTSCHWWGFIATAHLGLSPNPYPQRHRWNDAFLRMSDSFLWKKNMRLPWWWWQVEYSKGPKVEIWKRYGLGGQERNLYILSIERIIGWDEEFFFFFRPSSCVHGWLKNSRISPTKFRLAMPPETAETKKFPFFLCFFFGAGPRVLFASFVASRALEGYIYNIK